MRFTDQYKLTAGAALLALEVYKRDSDGGPQLLLSPPGVEKSFPPIALVSKLESSNLYTRADCERVIFEHRAAAKTQLRALRQSLVCKLQVRVARSRRELVWSVNAYVPSPNQAIC